MEQFVGMSTSGNLSEAIKGLNNPQFLMIFVAQKEQFAAAVEQLEKAFPGVPSIGCLGQSYGGTTVIEHGILVIGFKGKITAITNVIEEVSQAPVKYIRSIQDDIAAIRPGNHNTVMIDFCADNDECVLTTIQSAIDTRDIQLTGGTATDGLVAYNGKVYEDACAYALIRNDAGKVKVFRENIYAPMDDHTLVVTKAVPSQYTLCE